jgi:hypothetical protein
MTLTQKYMYIETVLLFNKKTRKAWDGIKGRIRLCMTGARATSGGDGARAPDWGDRGGGLKGVAWGPIKRGRRDVGVPGGHARAISGGDGAGWADWGDRGGGLKGVAWGQS